MSTLELGPRTTRNITELESFFDSLDEAIKYLKDKAELRRLGRGGV